MVYFPINPAYTNHILSSSSIQQIAELKRGAEIIVCTPGRMIDMLGANNGK